MARVVVQTHSAFVATEESKSYLRKGSDTDKAIRVREDEDWGGCKGMVICRPRNKKSVVFGEGGKRERPTEHKDQRRETTYDTTQQGAL